jgi:iron complex transport system substrate-binding protein
MRTQTSIGTIALLRLLTIAVLTVTTITACQGRINRSSVGSTATSTSSSNDCRNVEHEMGTTKVCGQPQRIVVLGIDVLESLLSLEIQPVGFADYAEFHQGDYDNPQEQIPYLGSLVTQPVANVGQASEPSIEAIVRAQPDLIIGTSFNSKVYQTLSQIAPTILLDYTEPEISLKTIAKAVNRSRQAEELLAETEKRIAAAHESFAPLVATHPKLLLLLTSSNLQQIYLNSDYLCSSLVKNLGFQLVSLRELKNSRPYSPNPISIETLPRLNDADLAIVFSSNNSELENIKNFNQLQLSNMKQAWQENAIAQSLDASKAGRVYFIPSYLCGGLPGAIGTKLYLEELEKQFLN